MNQLERLPGCHSRRNGDPQLGALHRCSDRLELCGIGLAPGALPVTANLTAHQGQGVGRTLAELVGRRRLPP